MRGEPGSPMRSNTGDWNSYNLWRITIDVPNKVQRVGQQEDDDDEIDVRRAHRKSRSAAWTVAVAVVLLLLLVASLLSRHADAHSIGMTASAHSEIAWRPTEI